MTNGFTLSLTYPELSFLRELLRKERFRLWCEKYTPILRKNTPIKEVERYYKISVEENRNPLEPQGLCNLILDQIDVIEEDLQATLRDGMDCPICGHVKDIIDEDKPKSKKNSFNFVPKWRKLSCGHVIDLIGKAVEEIKK
jgi:hypothetical protein